MHTNQDTQKLPNVMGCAIVSVKPQITNDGGKMKIFKFLWLGQYAGVSYVPI